MAKLPPKRVSAGGQTITTPMGSVIPSKYSGLKGARTTSFQPPPPERMWWLITGDVGEGKSTLGCSIPKAVIFDWERKLTGIKRLAPGSLILGDDPTWSLTDFDNVVNDLVSDAKAGKSPFDMVVFDTLGGYCEAVRSDFTIKNNAIGGGDPNRPWRDFASYGIDGAGYGAMNSWMWTRFLKLRNAGYGGSILAHREVKVVDADGSSSREIRTDGNPGIVKSLYRICEYSGRIMRERQVTRQPVTMKAGTTTLVKKETVVAYQYVLNLDITPPEAGPKEQTRQHVPMPSPQVVLPEGRGWDAICEAYNNAVAARAAEIQTSL